MNRWYKNIIVVLSSVLLFQCSMGDEEIPAVEQLKKDKQAIDKYVADKGLQGGYIFNDIYRVIVSEGQGTPPQVNEAVRINYKLELLDGTLVEDTSAYYQHGQSFFFNGFEACISAMKKNELSTFLIPSFYAYGPSPAKAKNITIPANSVLRLDVQLLDVVSASKIPLHYASLKNLSGDTTSTGVFYTITEAGTGENPKNGQSVTVKYKGYLLTGYSFDDSQDFTYVLGSNSIINGWNDVIPLLKVGDKATIVIPSSRAYGVSGRKDNKGRTIIPPNAVLVFDLHIINSK